MGRRCWPPKQPAHDIVNNLDTFPRKDAKAAPEYGYADFASGGHKYVAPPALGEHPLTKRNVALAASKGGRGAGLKAGLLPKGGGSWVAQSGWSLKENKPWERQGTSQPSEATTRFKAPPEGFVPRVTLAPRHATDQTCDLKGKFRLDYKSEQVANFPSKTQPRRTPFPPKPAEVHLGSNPVTYDTANLDHFPDKAATFKSMSGVRGGGLPLTKVPSYNVITGGAESSHNPKDHHGAARVRQVPRVPGDMPLLYVPPPQTNRAGYDIINGHERQGGTGWTGYEHFGASQRATRGSVHGGPAAGVPSGSRHERVSGSSSARQSTGHMSTRPW